MAVFEYRKGALVQLNGQPYQVVDYSQKVMGRGGSIVKVKLKHLLTGATSEKTISSADDISSANITNINCQYLYQDGQEFNFMDQETYEQYQVDQSIVGESKGLLKEGMSVKLVKLDGRFVTVELPIKVAYQVIETPEVVRGDTQSTVMKDAKLETGIEVKVPIFIKTGDEVVLDTRDGSYVERKKK